VSHFAYAGEVVRIALALLPVILFLVALRALDSFKLVSRRCLPERSRR
jgi:hypothetical protein